MKALLHWTSYIIVCLVAMPIHYVYGVWAYIGALAALSVALVLQWIEGRMSIEEGWSYRIWGKR